MEPLIVVLCIAAVLCAGFIAAESTMAHIVKPDPELERWRTTWQRSPAQLDFWADREGVLQAAPESNNWHPLSPAESVKFWVAVTVAICAFCVFLGWAWWVIYG